MTYSYTKHHQNPFQDNSAHHVATELFPNGDCETAQSIIPKWPNYTPTPLVSLTDIAEAAGVSKIFYKDESGRFGLGSFKALGGAYAVQYLANQKPGEDIVVCTATDGNHGKSVAWGAQLLGAECHIFIHANVSQGRADAMAAYGAVIHRIDGNYDDSIAACIELADKHGWHIVSDTSWEGYQEIPRQVMAGYSVMCREILDRLDGEKPTHIILQAGCGGMAGAVIGALWPHWKDDMPKVIIVESDMSDCVYESLTRDEIYLVNITEETMMAGLSCGEVSELAWPPIKYGVSNVITINDDGVAPMMRWLANPTDSTRPSIVGGECSASGLIGIMAIQSNTELALATGMDENSKVLVLGTEGNTDPEIYKKVMEGEI